MRLSQQLMEATYEADAKARAEANKVWDGVVAYVKSVKRWDARQIDTVSGGFVILPTDIEELSNDIAIVLVPAGYVRGGWGVGGGGLHVIRVGVLIGPLDMTHLSTRIESGRRVFVHEYTHYLDAKRRRVTSSRKGEVFGTTAYFRTPSEFNAYFQEVAYSVEAPLLRMARAEGQPANVRRGMKNKAAKAVSSFVAFQKYVEPHMGEIPKMLAGTKWERKWLKRMAVLYKGLKSKVDKAL